MSFYKFNKEEIVFNKVRSHPENRIYINKSASYFNNSDEPGLKPIRHVSGSVLEVARNSYDIRPVFVSTASYDSTSSLPSDIYYKNYFLSSSVRISSDYLVGAPVVYPEDAPTTADIEVPNPKLSALRNTLDTYTNNSIHYAYSASWGDYSWFKPEQDMMLIGIPSPIYGSQIQEGTVDLRFYFTGTLAGQLTDSNETGELVQVGGTDDGKVAGVVLYNEGFILLTGSWKLSDEVMNGATPEDLADHPRWKYFASQRETANNTSFDIRFNGTSYTPTMTMFAHANRGELNSSNNPTFIKHSASADGNTKLMLTGSHFYMENEKRTVENVVSSSFQSTGSFEKTTYLSSVGIYDDDQNLIGIAKFATPIRKREKDTYTFKLKVDM